MPDFNKKEMSEADIRSKFILPAILKQGWNLQTQIREEYPISPGRIRINGNECRRDHPQKADYVLFYKSNKPIAVVEAKDNNHTSSDGMQQALNYAQKLDVPFVFSSNGDEFIFHNKYSGAAEREKRLSMDEFPRPEVLWQQYILRNNYTVNQLKVIDEQYFTDNPDKQPRYYQIAAINRTVEAISAGQNRILLVMATGTGKTYTAFQIIWRLWKAGVKKRILFLADRRSLIEQTYKNDFTPFKDKMTWVSKANFDTAHEIYLGLYQGLSNTDDEDSEEQAKEDTQLFHKFSPGFFDLIVVDECHRGSAKANSRWREILTYFSSATQIGMTATPKETDEESNIDYFGKPVFVYSLKQGIEDGYLAPYRVLKYEFDRDREGFTPGQGQIDDKGQALPNQTFTVNDFDRTIVFPERIKKVAKIVSDYLKENNCRMDKSIFFCVDQEHASNMRQALVNENADMMDKDSRYVTRITADDTEGVKQLENFRKVSEEYPVLVTTSKLLSTGVDVQTVKYIILDSNIRSMNEFKQIIGRGTRVREDLGKMYFTIFDFRNVTQLFHDPDFDGPIENTGYIGPKDKPPKVIKGDKQPKYYVSGVSVNVNRKTVEYVDTAGNTVIEDLIDYTKKNVLGRYASYAEFFKAWNDAERKELVIKEMEEHGVLFEELSRQINAEYDPFDLVCHIAYDMPPLTRKERANNVRKRNYFTKYGEQASQILDAILTKYCDLGLSNIENIDVLKVAPISNFGTQVQIVNSIFGGIDKFKSAIRDLESQLYAET